jgi:hypothetical protein
MSHPRRAQLLALSIAALAPGLGCPSTPSEVCGLSTEDPLVVDRHLTATRDGAPFDEEGAYSPGPNASIDAGELTLVIAHDETGTETDDLIARGVFPICVRLGARGDRSGSALVNGTTFLTDERHEGAVAVLRDDGGLLVGRFEVTLVDSAGASTSFVDGAFRLPTRP